MKRETADHYNAIARGEMTVEEVLAPIFNTILGGIEKPLLRIPPLTDEEMQFGDQTADRA